MSDDLLVNGDADIEIAAKEDDSEAIQKLTQKLAISEQEKQELVNNNQLAAEKIKQLEEEIQSSESDKRALSSIAARAAELETEVSRLQHDLISSMSEGQESNAEISELKLVVEELKNSESEKSIIIDAIEKERNLLLQRLNESNNQIGELQSEIVKIRAHIEKSESKVKELESKIDQLQKDLKEKAVVIDKKRKVEWPVIAAAAGAVAFVGVVYFRYAKN